MGMHKLFNDDYSGGIGTEELIKKLNERSYELFKCRKCGSIGEEKFSWDGKCLICEDNDGEVE